MNKSSSVLLAWRSKFGLPLLLVFTIVGLWFTPHPSPVTAAPATIINVNTTTDELNFDGDCSLREAIRAANTDTAVDACPAGNGTDTINIPAGTYNLTLTSGDEDAKGDLDVQSDMLIQGAGAASTHIHGQMGERVMEVYQSIQVTVAGVTVSGGQDTGGASGGGILSQGNFTLEDSVVTGNTASSGGGVWNSGVMTITRSLITNNTDNGNAGGAGLGGSPDTLTTIIDSAIAYNVTSHGGGGIFTYNGDFVLINSTVSHNLNTGTLSSGAGLYISGPAAELTLINSTVSGNISTSTGGGGLYINSGSTAHLFNATIAYNSATNGGGILNNGTVNLQNSIIAQNTATQPGSPPDCGGSDLTSGGYNLIGNDTGCTLTGVSAGMIVDVDPLLGPLQDNGGETETHGLLYDSPARHAGNPGGCTNQNGGGLSTDQRGFPRPVGAACDMGAFESGLANLALTIAESGDPVAVGDDLTYTLTINNGGSQLATGVELVANLPTNTIFVTAVPDQGSCIESAGVVTCWLGSIANGSSAVVDILLAPRTAGTATMQADVTSNEIDNNLANNSDSENTTITPPPDLTIIKTDSPDPAYTGAPLTYQINVFAGPNPVNGVTMSDPLPATFDLDSVNTTAGSCTSTTTISCNLGNLAANAVVTVTIVGAPTSTDTLTNTATISGSPDPNPNNNEATAVTAVFLSADLAVTMQDDPDPVEIGSPLTYTIEVVNNGPSDATGVTLVDTLPPSLLSVTTDPSQGSCSGNPIVTCNLGTLASGASATVLIYVTTPNAYIGTIANSAAVSANEGDPNTSNNLATVNTTVLASNAVDLQMTKTASSSQAIAGTGLVYTLLVENLNENLDATNVTVIDNLPLEVGFVTATPGQGSCQGIMCDLGTIPAGGSATIQIVVTVDAGLAEGTVFTNRADVYLDEFDDNPGNNFDTVDVTVVEGFLIFLPVIIR